MQQHRYTVTITFTEIQAEQIGSLATSLGVPVAAIAKLAALRGLGQVTPRTLEAAQQSGEVRTTGGRRLWPGRDGGPSEQDKTQQVNGRRGGMS